MQSLISQVYLYNLMPEIIIEGVELSSQPIDVDRLISQRYSQPFTLYAYTNVVAIACSSSSNKRKLPLDNQSINQSINHT